MNQKSIKIALLILTCSVFASAGAENDFYEPPQITLPSPDAVAFKKEGDVSVNYFTGCPNISIPIYTIQEYGITIPVSISYCGGGIKVGEEASSVGLGWNLNVGGVISRTIQGFPDELCDHGLHVYGYKQLNHPISGYVNNNRIGFVQALMNKILDNPMEAASEPYRSLAVAFTERYDNGEFETSQDTYSFNFMGKTGTFVFDNSGTFVSNYTIQSNEPIHIHKSGLNFLAEDGEGFQYHFTQIDSTTFTYYKNYVFGLSETDKRTTKCPTSWWLTTVITPNLDTITFEYTKNLNALSKNFYGYQTYILYEEKNGFDDPNSGYPLIKWGVAYPSDSIKHDICLLKRIKTPTCIVDFERDDVKREDMENDYSRLKNIIVYRNDGVPTRIKRFAFTHSYFGSANASSFGKRLKLNSIKEYGTVDDNPLIYSFDYLQPDILPEKYKTCWSTDHWGYYTEDASDNIPPGMYCGIYNVSGNNNSGYRRADKVKGNAAMLSSITYPTGGRTLFQWEPNQYRDLSPLATRLYQSDNTFQTKIDFEPTNYNDTVSVQVWGIFNQINPDVQVYLPAGKRLWIDVSQYYPRGMCDFEYCVKGWNDRTFAAEDMVRLGIYKNNTLITSYSINKINSENTNLHFVPSEGGTYTFRILFPDFGGVYGYNDCQMLEEYMNGEGEPPVGFAFVKLYYNRGNDLVAGNHILHVVGGQRIKQIINYNADNTKAVQRQIYYSHNPDPYGNESGILTVMPRYGSYSYRYLPSYAVPGINCHHVVRLTSNGLPQTLTGIQPVEYPEVMEVKTIIGSTLEENLTNSRSVSCYSFYSSKDSECDDLDDTQYAGFVPSDMQMLTSRSYKRGMLKSKRENSDYTKTTVYDYSIMEKDDVPMIPGRLFCVTDFVTYGDSGYSYKNYGITKYRIIPYNKRLTSATETTDYNGTNVVQRVSYQFNEDNQKNYSTSLKANLPTSCTKILSSGDSIVQYFTYTNKNQIETSVSVKNGKIISANRYAYNLGQVIAKYTVYINPYSPPAASTFYLGTSLQTSSQLANFINVCTDSMIYRNKRLSEHIDKQKELTTVYLWAYKGAHPVAKIVNATYASVLQFISAPEIDALFNLTSLNTDFIGDLRLQLPNAQISTWRYAMLTDIIEQVAPNGITTKYDYDDFWRLKEIKKHYGAEWAVTDAFKYIYFNNTISNE